MNEMHGMYMIAVHPSRINYYYEPLNRHVPHSTLSTGHEQDTDQAGGLPETGNSVASIRPVQFRDNSHHGKISKTAERKINRAIDYMLYLAKPKKLPHTQHGKGLYFRLNFVTLTLSSEQIHTDHEISYRIFHPFLVALTRQFKIQHYIWRAERQSSGGLHYHLITDRFIPWQRLRELWNNAQQHLGYVTRYRENQLAWHSGGFRPRQEFYKKWSKEKQYKAYQEGCRTDWNSPNSTDVHSLICVKNVRAYFKKYMTKEGQNSDIKGRLWGCSQALSNIQGGRAAVWSKIDEELRLLEADKLVKHHISDYFTTIWITPDQLEAKGCVEILKCFNEFLQLKFPDYRPPSLFT